MVRSASRREFLRTGAALSVAGAATPFALNLAAIGSAAAQTDGYRALVCLFLSGGNDHTNTVVPFDPASHAEYAAARPSIALNRDELAATALGPVASQGGREFALHPSLKAVRQLYLQGHAAVLANVGPLVMPTTLAQYRARSVPLPPKLFSHNDQQSSWQACAPAGEGAPYGWGGTAVDQLLAGNAQSAFSCISASGQAVWLAGRQALPYQVSPTGALSFDALGGNLYGSGYASAAYRALLGRTSTNLFENELGAIHRRSIQTHEVLRAALPPPSVFATPVPSGNPLAGQLQVVARMIASRSALGLRRQIFLVGLGGFDHHDGLITLHAERLRTVDAAIQAFWAWLGQIGMQSAVTLFTASDFGRTLTSNGDGSDHGWGSHHLVIGGSVAGGTLLGEFPSTRLGTSVDVGQGRLLPTTSVDQYAATMARWLGVPDGSVPDVLPNIGNFAARYLPLLH